jgi:hypothetical protein
MVLKLGIKKVELMKCRWPKSNLAITLECSQTNFVVSGFWTSTQHITDKSEDHWRLQRSL